MNRVFIDKWPKEQLMHRLIRSARLLHIHGAMTDSELRRVRRRLMKMQAKADSQDRKKR